MTETEKTPSPSSAPARQPDVVIAACEGSSTQQIRNLNCKDEGSTMLRGAHEGEQRMMSQTHLRFTGVVWQVARHHRQQGSPRFWDQAVQRAPVVSEHDPVCQESVNGLHVQRARLDVAQRQGPQACGSRQPCSETAVIPTAVCYKTQAAKLQQQTAKQEAFRILTDDRNVRTGPEAM